jgi:hypothetical protein
MTNLDPIQAKIDAIKAQMPTLTQNVQDAVANSYKTGNTSAVGLPNDIGKTLNVGETPKANAPLDASKLTGDTSWQNVLKSAVGNDTTMSSVAGLLSLYDTAGKEQAKYDETAGQLSAAINSLGGESADLAAAYGEQGVNENYTKAKEMNLEIAGLKGELEKFDAETQTGLSNIENQSVPLGLIQGQQAAYNKQRDLTRLSKAAELSAKVGVMTALQGNIELGMKLAQNSVDMKYRPIENNIKLLQQQLSIAGEGLSREDKKKSTIIETLLKFKSDEVAAQKQEETDNRRAMLDLMVKYPDSGISFDDTMATAQSKLAGSRIYQKETAASGTDNLLSPTEAAALGVPYGTTEAQAAQMGITPQGKTSQAQQTVAGFAARIEQSSNIIKTLESKISGMNYLQYQYYSHVPSALQSADYQQYDQAARNLINSILRRESGAVISDQEFDNARKQYLPQPGDKQATLDQKRANIEAVLNNYKNAAGNAYESVDNLVNGSGAIDALRAKYNY